MLKRIGVDQLRLGMHIDELCGSWMEHPFWRSGFLLDDARDIGRIVDSGIKEVWIDTGKGLDVATPEAAGATREEAEAEIEHRLVEAAAMQERSREPTTMQEEVVRAAKICAEAKKAVVSMFQEARMGKAIEAENVAPLVEEISASVMRNPGALISLARLKTTSDYTYMHSVAVCALMVSLARQIGLDEAQTREAGTAGLLHDIGKMMIPNEVLEKPGKLTDDEFTLIKTHPAEGHQLLLAGKGIGDVALDVCLHHHEKVDGSGYPDKLAGDGISLFAKMGAVCDVYDAITSDRPYKRGWDPAESLRKMAEWSHGHFEEWVFQAFVKSVGIYPIGALVRLKSGCLGVVVEQTQQSLLKPRIKVFYSIKSASRFPPEIVDLSSATATDAIAAREDPGKWNFPDLIQLWSHGQTAF